MNFKEWMMDFNESDDRRAGDDWKAGTMYELINGQMSAFDIMQKRGLEERHGWTLPWIKYWFTKRGYLDDPIPEPEPSAFKYRDQFECVYKKDPSIVFEMSMMSMKGYYWIHIPRDNADYQRFETGEVYKNVPHEDIAAMKEILSTTYPDKKHALNHAIDLGFDIRKM